METIASVLLCLCVICWTITLQGSDNNINHRTTRKPENNEHRRTEIEPSAKEAELNYSSVAHVFELSLKKTHGMNERVTDNFTRTMTYSSYDFSQEIEDIKLANEHYTKMRLFRQCKTPSERIIKVKDIYPDPFKEYIPKCTILHRCGDDSGCCDNDSSECVARSVQEVMLTFYVINVGKPRKNAEIRSSISKLLFINHTECECQPITDMLGFEESYSHTNVEPSTDIKKCRECPVPYARRDFSDGRCSCDCFDRHKPCLKIKRGKETLPEVERRCVATHHCHVPECEYGDFDVDAGSCPKRPEHHRHFENRMQNSHRWSHLERD